MLASPRRITGLSTGGRLLPENSIPDEVSAVAVNARGDVLVLPRGGRKWPESNVLDQTPIPVPTIFVFDAPTGRLLTKWGEKLFALSHSLRVDHENNVWVTDVALHQVYKFSRDGKLLLTLGDRGIAGAVSSRAYPNPRNAIFSMASANRSSSAGAV